MLEQGDGVFFLDRVLVLQIVGFWRFGNGNSNLELNVCLDLFYRVSTPELAITIGLAVRKYITGGF